MRGHRGVSRLKGGAVVLVFCAGAFARVPYPVHQSYTDTLRVGILCNWVATGNCPSMPPVGPQTIDFVVDALDTTNVKNVKINLMSFQATEDTVLALFDGKLPHVLVHINAGWGHSSDRISRFFSWASQYNVGLVAIGDDDARILDTIFDWVSSPAHWGPMATGSWLLDEQDTLWARLKPGSDNTVDSTAYPRLNGVIRNTAHRILRDSTLYFKPFGYEDGRCESDPDPYAANPGLEHRITRLGYQQGYNANCDTLSFSADPTCSTIIGDVDEWTFITILEDSIPIGNGIGKRRAVALSTQPQFLQDSVAAKQLVYDCVMYASLVHMGNPAPNAIEIPPVSGARFRNRPSAEAKPAAFKAGDRLRIADTRGRVVYDGIAGAWKGRLGKQWHRGVYVFTVTTPSGAVRSSSEVVETK